VIVLERAKKKERKKERKKDLKMIKKKEYLSKQEKVIELLFSII